MPLMSIEVPPEEVYRLAATLRGAADGAGELGARLAGSPSVGRLLQSPVEDLLECHRAAARALAGELSWLAATVTSVADSWLQLDESLLAPLGRSTLR
jgi:hypothetical protein